MTSTAPADVLERWLESHTNRIGRHALLLLTENVSARSSVIDELRQIVRDHYVAAEVARKRLADLGAPRTAALLREHLPTSKKARSGDLGEILATEVAERRLEYVVPIRRLRWKDGRDMALRGDDIVGLARDRKNKLQFLKGESKSRAMLATGVLGEAAVALDRDRGRPSRHSVLFVADRLREQGMDDIAMELEEAVLQSFKGCIVEHLIFTLVGNDPAGLLSEHLKTCEKKRRRRHAVGVCIVDHGRFIDLLYGGL